MFLESEPLRGFMNTVIVSFMILLLSDTIIMFHVFGLNVFVPFILFFGASLFWLYLYNS